MSDENVKFRISLEDFFSQPIQNAEKLALKFEGQIDSIGHHIGRLKGELAGAFTGFMAGVEIKEAFNDAVQAQMSLKTLSLAVGNSGGLTSDFEELKKVSTELSETGIFSPGKTREAAQSMLNFGFSIDQVKDALPVLEDMAASVNKPLDEVIQSVNMAAAGGRALALKQFGLGHLELKKQFEDATDQAKGLASNFQQIIHSAASKYSGGNTDIRLHTEFGQLEAFKNEWHHFMVDIGKELIPIFQGAVPYIKDFMHALEGTLHFVKDNSEWLGNLAKAVGLAYAAFLAFKYVPFIIDGITNAIVFMSGEMSLVLATNPIFLAIGAVGLLAYAWYDVADSIDAAENAKEAAEKRAYMESIKSEQDAIESLTESYMKNMKISKEVAREKAIAFESSEIDKQIKDITNQLASWDISSAQTDNLNMRLQVLKGNKMGLGEAKKQSNRLSTDNDLGSGIKDATGQKITNVTISMGNAVGQFTMNVTKTIDGSLSELQDKVVEVFINAVNQAAIVAEGM
ncbi:hypothetical protein UFOVP1596_6 [uncultured Caudovirales phage]|uniref:Uncharacterized protein n=1 Tax=uncultured Caudovirales phage TaxID=2100421 RepID=A0A6J5STY6_9CAUD|nr:hypothetical protein UFOVP1596_6 [uncultured Caudovirales phage]